MEKDKNLNFIEGLRYYNDELSIESDKLMKEKKRIKDFRKQLTSDTKIKNTKKFFSSEEDRLTEWFEKIKKLKEDERKKVKGNWFFILI